MRKSFDWDAKVQNCFAERFATAPHVREYYLNLWVDHKAAGLADSHFVSELTGSSTEKFWQRVWEMALGRHLRACGHQITTRSDGYPDYYFDAGRQRVWVEAVSPSPGPDLPRHWTHSDPHQPSCGATPNKEMLLRWTAAFKEKAQKCAEYRRKGIVKPTEAFVIAIDGTQLSKFPDTCGISGFPFVVEIVFAIGPRAISIDRETGIGSSFQTVETSVENRNKAPVPKGQFFSAEFSGISAVLGCYAASGRNSPGNTGILPVQVAYNPRASCSLVPGQFGAGAEEWIANCISKSDESTDWHLQRLDNDLF